MSEEQSPREWRVVQPTESEEHLTWMPGEFVPKSTYTRVVAELDTIRSRAAKIMNSTDLHDEVCKLVDENAALKADLEQRDERIRQLEHSEYVAWAERDAIVKVARQAQDACLEIANAKMQLTSENAEMKRQLDAYEKSPPTLWAYEQACKALERKTRALERAKDTIIALHEYEPGWAPIIADITKLERGE